jgi:hypothetical protein
MNYPKITNEAEVLQKAIETYGEENQMDMAIEEMSELTKSILKLRRVKKTACNNYDLSFEIKNVLEEMADVQIMLDQLYLIFGKPVEQRKYKIKRLESRLE